MADFSILLTTIYNQYDDYDFLQKCLNRTATVYDYIAAIFKQQIDNTPESYLPYRTRETLKAVISFTKPRVTHQSNIMFMR